MEKQDELRTLIKRDIARFYLTGKTTLKSLTEHYNLKPHSMNRIVTELVREMSEKPNTLY